MQVVLVRPEAQASNILLIFAVLLLKHLRERLVVVKLASPEKTLSLLSGSGLNRLGCSIALV